MKVKDLLPYIEGGETVVIVNDNARYFDDSEQLVDDYGERNIKGISAYLNDLYITLEKLTCDQLATNLRPTCDQLATNLRPNICVIGG